MDPFFGALLPILFLRERRAIRRPYRNIIVRIEWTNSCPGVYGATFLDLDNHRHLLQIVIIRNGIPRTILHGGSFGSDRIHTVDITELNRQHRINIH